jgi:pimeloyl-ACP methyl ester carboxylesterase
MSFPTPKMIKSNGIDMAVYEAGPADGIPVVLLHGFAELAYSWRHQLPALAEAGYHVLAPDQRGYGLTSRPKAVEDYDIDQLTGDLIGLLDAYGIAKAVFCGHGFGGAVAWAMPLLHEARVKGVIGVNAPFVPRPAIDPILAARAEYGDNIYIVEFQKPGVAEAALEKDVARSFRFFMRKNAITLEEFRAAPKDNNNLSLLLSFKLDEAQWQGEPLLTPEELGVFVEAFSCTGFTPALNWYRNLTRNWRRMEKVAQKIKLPGLLIMAEDDILSPPAAAKGMEGAVPDLEKALIYGGGPWTPQEHPYRTNAIMIDWLKRRFIA